MKKKTKLKPGDAVQVFTLDHTSDDHREGWAKRKDLMFGSTPSAITIRGFYVGQTKGYITVAFSMAEPDSFGTLFHILKNPSLKVSKQ